ncbi:ADP-ribosylation factor-like protein 10 [Eudromia elegans]
MALLGAFRHLALALGAAVAAVAALLCIAWQIYSNRSGTYLGWDDWWEREMREMGELQSFQPPEDALDCRQVLVLGLDGAGKSSVLHYICSRRAKESMAPTEGFRSARLRTERLKIELLEVGGNQNLRSYWRHYLSQAHVLVFVVDSVDRSRLVTARQELHALLAEDPRLPLVVLANKQDKSDALTVAELHDELALHTLSGQRDFFLLPTSATQAGLSTATSVLHVKSLLLTLLSQP